MKINSCFPTLRKSINFSPLENCFTYVIAAVASPVKENNKINSISCRNLIPLGGFVYDLKSDSYLIECFDYLRLGTLPIGFLASIESIPNWTANVPLPPKVIRKFLSRKQKKDLDNFFDSFDDTFRKFYIQMLNPNES